MASEELVNVRNGGILYRSRRELSHHEYLLSKFSFETAENEPCKVCLLSAYRSPRFRLKNAKWAPAQKADAEQARREEAEKENEKKKEKDKGQRWVPTLVERFDIEP